MSNEKPEKKSPARVTLELSKDLKPVYANLAFLTHTPAEMVLDFAQILPRTPKGQIVSRVIMSPMHAKSLMKALVQNIENYERQYGEIKMPQQPHIADQLFRFPPQGGEDGDQDDTQ